MPRKPRAVVHFTAEPQTGRIVIGGQAPTVQAAATIEPGPGTLRIRGRTPTIEAYLDEVDRIARAGLSICPDDDERRKHFIAIIRAARRGRPPDEALRARIRSAAKSCLKKDGTPNISKIARVCDCDRQTVKAVIN